MTPTWGSNMEVVLKVLVDYKIVDICIGAVGVFGLYLIIERFKALYFDLALPTEQFMKQVTQAIENDKTEEAITFCAANEKKPLAYCIKKVLEKADRENEAMEHALEIAAGEISPKLTKNLGHVQMVANVVTLIGLLGTVTGLIIAFKAVSFADVSQKQTLLAEGISIAMSATAMALMVAIPTMFLYSFLHTRQSKLFSDLDLQTNKILELLRGRGFAPFKQNNMYPNGMRSEMVSKGKLPPAPNGKAA
jgi:biopolymer transport protein ExbB